MMRLAVTFGLLLCLAIEVRGDDALRAYRYVRPIERTEAQNDELLSLTLDPAIFGATENDYADIRVVDAQEREVPYRIIKAVERSTKGVSEKLTSRVLELRELPEGRLEIVAALDERAPSARKLNIRTPLKDFERRVEVFGSTDGRDWHPLVTDALLFDYSRYLDLNRHEIDLPENLDRQYRLVFDARQDEVASPLTELTKELRGGTEVARAEQSTLAERPFRVDGIDFFGLVARDKAVHDVECSYPVTEFKTSEDARTKSTIIEVRTEREPIKAFTLQTPTVNFVRRATVQQSRTINGRTDWHEVGSATISSIKLRGIEQERLTIEFPASRAAEYRIVIENEDNPPLAITGVSARGDEYRLQFIAAKDETYALYYGSPTVKSPKYDTAAIIQVAGEPRAVQTATLGSATDNPDYKPGVSVGWLNSPLLFTAAIILLVVILAVVVYGAVRRVDQLPTDE